MEEKLTTSSEKRWHVYTKYIHKFDWLIILLSIALFALTINYVKQIKVVSDFKSMLPDKAKSVVNLNRIEKRVRGTDNLMVIIKGDDWNKVKPFVNDYVTAIKEQSNKVQRIDFKTTEAREYFEKNKYLYIELGDLQEIHDRLKRKIDFEKIKELPFYVNFGDEEPEFTTADIEEKYEGKTPTSQNYIDDYFTNPEGTLSAMIVWPMEGATNITFSREMIAELQKIGDDLISTGNYDPSIKIVFDGRIRKMILEYDSILGDILKTTVMVLLAVGFIVLLYFRKLRMGALMTLNVLQGTLVSLMFAYFAIGYLTTQTAFLGAIIVGNGIDYSLILMSRYLEERREKNKDVLESLSISLAHTWRPTLTSSLTTTAAFLALMATQIKGFSQFGFIGGIGMPLCWLSTYFFLPAWLSISERIWAIKKANVTKHFHLGFFDAFCRSIIKRENGVLKLGFALTLASIVLVTWYLPNSLEYNFEKLNFKPIKESNDWQAEVRREVKWKIFKGQSQTPSIIIADSPEQANDICKVIDVKDIALGGGYVEKCITLMTYVPENQEKKIELLGDINRLFTESTLKFMNEKQLEEVENFKRSVDLEPITTKDLPQKITDLFKDLKGNEGIIAYVYPKIDLWQGHELMRFADLISETKLPSGETIETSGHPVILADLLRAVVKEGPFITILSLLCIMILVWFNLRNMQETLLITASLLTGTILLVGLMSVVGIKLNFLNFVALPITFGIGVDYSINIYQRMKQDNFEHLEFSFSRIVGAVVLCSLTTTVGYSVLLTSRSQALVSFGLVALLGETACLISAVFMLPLILVRLKRAGLLPFDKKTSTTDIIKTFFINKTPNIQA